MLATLTSKGQVTLPKEIRDALKLSSGAKLDFSLQADGSVNIRPMQNSVASLFGILKRPGGKAFSIEEQKASVGRALAEKHGRILREAALPAARDSRKRAP
ncbi:AbrB/MazE/SpoVT family DNA-binding domain-containing protein [soil metagenome]